MRRLSGLRALWPAAVLIALPFVFHWKLFASEPGERTIFRGDFLSQHYAWKSYALSRVEGGELPLWNPHVLGGVAIHANPQVGIFYPPTYLLLPFTHDGLVDYTALEMYQLLHLAFAGLGMWLFLRSLGIGNLGGLTAAMVFMFTGFFTTPGHHAIVLTASWLPWALLAVRRSAIGTTASSIALMALAFAGLILAGHPQVAYYALILTGLFAWALLGIKTTLKKFLPAAVLSLGIAAIQLLPTFELAEASSRATLGYDYSSSFGLSPYFLSAAFVPRGQVRLPGQEGAAPLHVYVGIGTLLLAVIALTLSESGWQRFFAATALVALLLSFGRDSPLFDWFYAGVPGFSRFRVPYRLLGIYAVSMSVLAGLGVQVLQEAGRRARVRLRSISRAAFVCMLCLAAWAAYVHTGVARAGALPPEQLDRLVGGAYAAVLLGALHVGALVMVVWRPRERWAVPLIVGITALDLAFFVKDRGEHDAATMGRTGERFVHRVVRAQGYASRHASESGLENYSMLHSTDFIGGHAALVDARYAELMELSRTSANALALLNAKFIDRRVPPSEYPWCGARFESPLPLLDVTAEMSPAQIEIWPPVEAESFRLDWRPLGPSGAATIELHGEVHALEPGRALELRFDGPREVESLSVRVEGAGTGIRLDSIELDLNPIGLRADFLTLGDLKINLHTLPRAYFMEPSDVPSERLDISHLECWSVHDGVQVEDVGTGEGSAGFFRKNVATIVSREPERIEIASSTPRAGFVILADTYRPGWTATVDGAAARVLRAQWAMRAVAVPAGEHNVVFRYQPTSLRTGAAVTAFSALVVALLLGASRLRLRAAPAVVPEDNDFVTDL